MLPLLTVFLPLVLLFCGLSVDVGMLELKKAQMQSAADAAALGAALEAERGTNNWVGMGQSEAAQNGFTNGSNGIAVSVVEQPSEGAYANHYDAVEATITQKVQTVFMGAINGGKVTVTAKASALITPCVFLTGTTLQYYTFDGQNGNMKGESCPIDINNNLETQTLSLAPEALNIAGPASSSNIQGYQWPTPFNYNAPTVTDPLSYVAEPALGTCTHTGYSLYNVSANTTLSPGTYCQGLNITNSTATLSPGLYVVTGGGTWYNSTVTGTGVTLFFTSGGGGTDSKFILSQSTVKLSAPTVSSGGSIAGILVFTDRNWTHTNPQDVDIINSNFIGDGIWYLPSTGLYLQNNSGSVTGNNYMGLVADNLTIVGTSFVPLNNYTSLQTGNPMRTQGALVQ